MSCLAICNKVGNNLPFMAHEGVVSLAGRCYGWQCVSGHIALLAAYSSLLVMPQHSHATKLHA
jgi:hypothetical protein